MSQKDLLKQQILDLTREYYKEVHGSSRPFEPGKSSVNYGGRYFDDHELVNLVDSSFDLWLATDPWARKLEIRFAEWLGVKYCSLTDSGSSANLLAFMALTSLQPGERRIGQGDEVTTVAYGFPTMVTPYIQYSTVPVFVDVTIPEYNIDVVQLEAALFPKTKVVVIAYSLGSPSGLQAIKDLCNKHNLWLVEDSCGALGSIYTIGGIEEEIGTIDHIGTSSFYSPHHMVVGEGGAVYTDDPLLHKLMNFFRDWDRDRWCIEGVGNMCKYRFSKQLGDLPVGYDRKYVYSYLGYNPRVTDMQAAVGCAQLEKLNSIVEARRSNFVYLKEGLVGTFGFILPEAQKNSDPSWFGFLISVEEDASLTRNDFSQHLENRKIQIHNLFAGNLLEHPAFDEMRSTGEGYRVVGNLEGTDYVMDHTLWIGVYPGMTRVMLDHMIGTIHDFVSPHK